MLGFCIGATNVLKTVQFYCNETGLFRLASRPYMGSGGVVDALSSGHAVLESIHCGAAFIVDKQNTVEVKVDQFAVLEVDGVRALYSRISSERMNSGGGISKEGLVGTPLGEMFWLRDPDGRLLQIVDKADQLLRAADTIKFKD